MNNLIILLCAGLFATTSLADEYNDCKYSKGQLVKYKVVKFYKLVCSGEAQIDDVSMYDNVYTYTLKTSSEELGCPSYLYVKEQDIIKVLDKPSK